MTDEMKPVRCGCGGEAVIYVTHWWGKCYVCECEECGTASRPCTTEAEAITAWNRAMSGNVQECAKDARCNGMSDLISRQDVIDAFELGLENDYIDAIKLLEYVRQLPSAEPERKKGEWVYKPDEYDDSTYECSQCGEPWTLIDGTPEENNMKFCPNCGADMRGE